MPKRRHDDHKRQTTRCTPQERREQNQRNFHASMREQIGGALCLTSHSTGFRRWSLHGDHRSLLSLHHNRLDQNHRATGSTQHQRQKQGHSDEKRTQSPLRNVYTLIDVEYPKLASPAICAWWADNAGNQPGGQQHSYDNLSWTDPTIVVRQADGEGAIDRQAYLRPVGKGGEASGRGQVEFAVVIWHLNHLNMSKLL